MNAEAIAPFRLPVVPRLCRVLMLAAFIVLQAMAPFLHAHAGDASRDHAAPVHLPQLVPDGAACDALVGETHGVAVAVEPAVRLRASGATPVDIAAAPLLPRLEPGASPGDGWVAPPRPVSAFPDYTLPHALAPPAA